jgi:hypothetical protein
MRRCLVCLSFLAIIPEQPVAERRCYVSQAKYYSPKIARQLGSKLYWEAQIKKIPMTKLVNQIVAEGLGNYGVKRARRHRKQGTEQLLLDLHW